MITKHQVLPQKRGGAYLLEYRTNIWQEETDQTTLKGVCCINLNLPITVFTGAELTVVTL